MNAVKMCASIRSRAVFREELQLPDVAFLVEGLDGALPFLALRAVQLAEVERLALEDSTTDAHVLHHAPVVVDLAVLESPFST